MLTVVVLLSGPHRLSFLEQAIDSIPLHSPLLHAVHVMHQDGPWNWAPQLRERLAAEPKVRIIEFDQRLGFVDNFNRCMNLVESRWGLLLPDDDLLMPEAFARMLEVSQEALDSRAGFIAYGWYYLKGNRYLPDHVRRYDAAHLQRYTPKFCTTMINVERFRAVGGFDMAYGGFCDTVLFAELAYRYNAWSSPTQAGIYRLHDQQATASASKIYVPYVEATARSLGRFAVDETEQAALLQRMRSFAEGGANGPGPMDRAVSWLSTGLRGRAVPEFEVARAPTLLLAE